LEHISGSQISTIDEDDGVGGGRSSGNEGGEATENAALREDKQESSVNRDDTDAEGLPRGEGGGGQEDGVGTMKPNGI
jgi:hypothetical protein